MMQSTCTTCPRPVPDTAFGCPACAVGLARSLDELAAILPELGVTVGKQDRIMAGGVRGTGEEVPLPYRPQVAEKGRAIQGELVTWARHVYAESGREIVGSTGSAVARYLGSMMDWVRYRQEWPEMHAALRGLLGSTLHLVDRPADKVYLGPCRTPLDGTDEACWADVMAKPGAAFGKCRQCGTEHEVAKSREWLLKALEGHLARPVEIAGVLRGFGDARIGYSTIAAYVADHRIVERGHDGHGRPLYRIGDVLALRAQLRKRATREGEVLASVAPRR